MLVYTYTANSPADYINKNINKSRVPAETPTAAAGAGANDQRTHQNFKYPWLTFAPKRSGSVFYIILYTVYLHVFFITKFMFLGKYFSCKKLDIVILCKSFESYHFIKSRKKYVYRSHRLIDNYLEKCLFYEKYVEKIDIEGLRFTVRCNFFLAS